MTLKSMNHFSYICLAIGLFTPACSHNAKDYLSRGNQLFLAAKYEDAAIAYRKALQKDPKLGEAYYRLAITAERRNESAEALHALMKAVELMPTYEEALVKLA